MEFYTLASGSSGNCSLVCAGDTLLLIDAGISCRRITQSLAVLNLTLDDLDGILITHEHIDHVKGLAMFLKKTEVPVFASRGTAAALTAKEPAFEGRLTAFESATSSERFGASSSRFHKVSIRVLMLSRFSTSNCPESV